MAAAQNIDRRHRCRPKPIPYPASRRKKARPEPTHPRFTARVLADDRGAIREGPMKRYLRPLLALAIVLAIAAFFALDLARFFSRDFFLAQRAAIEAWRAAHPWSTEAAFFVLYVAVTSLSLPGAVLLTL